MSLQTQTSSVKIFSLAQRLTIIQQLIEQLRPKNALKVLVNDDPMLPHQKNPNEGNIVHTYELIGSKSLRKTQNNNLFQKLEVMHKTQVSNKIAKPLPDQSQGQADNEQTDHKENLKVIDDNQKAFFRYFSENIKCFRCKKIGHHDFACLDEFSCNLCLSSEHHSEKCPQKIVCFKCYNFGHMLNECPYKEEGPFCHNCKRKHFDKCGFLLKGTEQVKQMFIMDGLYFNEQIRCLKCFKYGHFNCEISEGTALPFKRPYQSLHDKNERRQSREKYFNPLKKHKY